MAFFDFEGKPVLIFQFDTVTFETEPNGETRKNTEKEIMKILGTMVCALAASVALNAAEVLFENGQLLGGNLPKNTGLENGMLTWKHAKANQGLHWTLKKNDFSKAKALEISLEASKAGQCALILESKPEGAKDFNYFAVRQNVKAGAQTWTIPLKDFWKARNPVGWNKIDSILITFDGWELKNEPGTELKIKSIKFID